MRLSSVVKLFWIAPFALFTACRPADEAPGKEPIDAEVLARIEAIHETTPFADMHGHPSRFHRSEVPRITTEELTVYRDNFMDVIAANISTDAAFSGGYITRAGDTVPRGQHKPAPGTAFALTVDRMMRLQETIASGEAVLADNPATVLNSRENGNVAVLPALEGADGLEGSIENFYELHELGLRLIQLVHFRANELGHIQTYPYSPGGLTDFGKQVVVEANRLGVVVDLAHANTETIMDALALSEHPVIFSHTGVNALHPADRHLEDHEIRAIAEKGGVVGIWPNGSQLPDLEDMLAHIDYVRDLAGINHVGIGSDLRGMSTYSAGFDSEARFAAIAAGLLERGYSDEDVGKVMGGNFFRVWTIVTGN
ncbi:MAG: dipeptidase [Gemmatimonadota bacterium]|nr:dipeptidase [Gemmatimonadota bacterium]